MTAWNLALAAALLLANAFFVAAEFGLIAVRRTRVEQLAAEGDGRAHAALRLIRELSVMLSGAQLGITMASLGLGYVAEPAVADLLEGPLGAAGLPEGLTHTVAFVVALSLVVFLHMVVGEMVPKNIAIAQPERTALWLALPMRVYAGLFRPVIRGLTGLANGALRLLGVEPRDELVDAHSAEEIGTMIAASRREGLLEDFEHRLLSGAVGFGDRTAASVMVPTGSVVGVPLGATPAEIERVVLESGHSRIPVRGAEPDDVLGYVHAKDLLTVDDRARSRPFPSARVRRMLVTPAGATLHTLLLRMRRARLHFALVRDGGRRPVGIVTLEDVLEALVGDIRDEHDRPRRPFRWSRPRAGRAPEVSR